MNLPSLLALSCVSFILMLDLHCGGTIPSGLLSPSFCPVFQVVSPVPSLPQKPWSGKAKDQNGEEGVEMQSPQPHLHLLNKTGEICMALSSPEMPPALEWMSSGQHLASGSFSEV